MPSLPRVCAVALLSLVGTGVSTRALGFAPEAPGAREPELLAKLRSEAPEAEKAVTCKLLAVHGTPAAVPDLAALLANERLASWARIALEAIPGPEADAALRTFVERPPAAAPPRLVVGPINSLGVRRDVAAVPLLQARLAGEDAVLAAAAAAALGRIATPEAGTALVGALTTGELAKNDEDLRDTVAHAAVVCAERLLEAGRADAAVALCTAVRGAKVSTQRMAEATRGAILARGTEGLPLLVELLSASEPRLARMGLFTARDLPRGADGAAVDRALAEALGKALEDPQAGRRVAALLDVLGERRATPALPAILDAVARGPEVARPAGVAALGRIGGPATVAPLLAIAAADTGDLGRAAREAIAGLEGQEVDREIVARLADADAKALPAIVALVGQRRIPAADRLVPLVDHASPEVRTAAVVALGEVVDLPQLDVLVKATIAAPDAATAPVAAKALRAAAVRMADREACAAKLAAALERVPAGDATAPTRVALLETLAEVGGVRALAVMKAAAASADDDAATRLLGTWMTPDAADVLIGLAAAEPPARVRGVLLRQPQAARQRPGGGRVCGTSVRVLRAAAR